MSSCQWKWCSILSWCQYSSWWTDYVLKHYQKVHVVFVWSSAGLTVLIKQLKEHKLFIMSIWYKSPHVTLLVVGCSLYRFIHDPAVLMLLQVLSQIPHPREQISSTCTLAPRKRVVLQLESRLSYFLRTWWQWQCHGPSQRFTWTVRSCTQKPLVDYFESPGMLWWNGVWEHAAIFMLCFFNYAPNCGVRSLDRHVCWL